MIDAQRFDAPVECVFLVNRRKPFHGEIEFKRHAVRIKNTQGSSLERTFDPFNSAPLPAEICGGAVNILLGKQAERQIAAARHRATPQNQTVVAPFLHRPKADNLGILEGHLQPKRIGIEGAAGVEVGDDQLRMRHPHDIEGWIKVWGRYRHGSLLKAKLGNSTWRCGEGNIARFHVEVE